MARKENYNIDKVIADYDRIIKELEEKGEQLRVKKAVSELEKIKPSESLEKKNKIKL